MGKILHIFLFLESTSCMCKYSQKLWMKRNAIILELLVQYLVNEEIFNTAFVYLNLND